MSRASAVGEGRKRGTRDRVARESVYRKPSTAANESNARPAHAHQQMAANRRRSRQQTQTKPEEYGSRNTLDYLPEANATPLCLLPRSDPTAYYSLVHSGLKAFGRRFSFAHLAKDIVGHAKRPLQRNARAGDFEQPVVGDDDEGVHRTTQLVDGRTSLHRA